MIDISIDKRSAKLLRDALIAAEKKTTRTAQDNGKRAAYFISRSLSAAVKPKSTRTKREIMPNPTRSQIQTAKGRKKRFAGAKYVIKRLVQDGPPTFIPTNKKSDRRRKIANLGLAASSFRWAAGSFGRRPKGKKVRGASKFATGRWKAKRGAFTATIISYLSYITKAFPGAADQAIAKGTASFVRSFDRDWARAIAEGRY